MPNLLVLNRDSLALDADIRVDHHELSALLTQLNNRSPTPISAEEYAQLRRADLLPGWYDEWLSCDQERFHLLWLSALETAASNALTCGDLATALDAATTAVAADPLRESAQRALLRVHLAIGNYALALNAYNAYCETLRRELGVQPSEYITNLIRPVFD